MGRGRFALLIGGVSADGGVAVDSELDERIGDPGIVLDLRRRFRVGEWSSGEACFELERRVAGSLSCGGLCEKLYP